MSDIFRALHDPTRRAILQLLRERDMTAGEIAAHFPIAKPTLSKHFAVLKEADLIQGTRVETTITYTLNVSVLEQALCGLLETFRVQPRKNKAKDNT
jgi:ArsR family transcriptional regulator, arsenate/arsenite/antimonite-responsive transcriptional repressor